MTITIYNKSNCVQCAVTYRVTDKADLPYETMDIFLDAQALEQIKSLGHAQVPIVVAGEDHWSDFRPDKIEILTLTIEPATV